MALRGPTEWSNWVIPGMLIAGAYPGSLDDRRNDRVLKCCLSKGVDTFVCLQGEMAFNNDIPEAQWRAGVGLRPYFLDAERLSKKPLKWSHCPIEDGGIAPDDVTVAFV